MTSWTGRTSVLAACLALLAGCADAARQAPDGHFRELGVQPGRADRVMVCHSFGCARRTPVRIDAGARAELARMFASARDAKGERRAIGKAVQWFDRRFGPQVGTDRDVGGFDPGNAGKIGQQDCIDEATSTAGLMMMIEKNGLLKYHKVGRPVARGFFLDMRYPHATATIIAKTGGQVWAVDPWPYDAGASPDIIHIERWFKIMRGGVRDQAQTPSEEARAPGSTQVFVSHD